MSKPYVYCRANYVPYRVVDGVRLYKVVVSDMDGPASIVMAVNLNNTDAVEMAQAINAALNPHLVKEQKPDE